MNTRRLGDDQPGAAGGPGSVVGDEIIVRHAAVDHHGHVTGGGNAILDRQRPDGPRRKEVGKIVGHGTAPVVGMVGRMVTPMAPLASSKSS